MKKVLIAAFLVCFLSASMFAEEKKEDGFNWAPVVLIASDAVLATASVMALVQQNTLAKDYDTLRLLIDNTTEANYYRLLYEKEKVTSATDTAIIACSAAGAAIAYTLLDYFWLHGVFKPSVAWTGDGVKLGMTVKY